MTEQQKNRDFVQINRGFMDAIAKMGENPRALELFFLLCKHMDGSNALCVSVQALMELMDVSKATVLRSIKYLKDNGWICVLKSGTSNVYIINPDVAWTSYANQKTYCKFQANIILSASENNEFLNNPKATTHFKKVDEDFMRTIAANNQRFENECEDIKDQLPGQVELKDVI